MMRVPLRNARRPAHDSFESRRSGVRCPDALVHRARMPLALRARALWKSYAAGVAGCSARVWVLRGASLEVEHGECVAVLGARGAGTTTLLHCLAGFRNADAGTIERALHPRFISAAQGGVFGTDAFSDGILLCDDGPACGSSANAPRLVRESRPSPATIVIATHELARVRHVADRVLLLRDGRLAPLDRATGWRRVAEPPRVARAISDTRAPARPGTVRA